MMIREGRMVLACRCRANFDQDEKRKTVDHSTLQHTTTAKYNTTQHNTTQHSTAKQTSTQRKPTQRNTTQHNTTQHNTKNKTKDIAYLVTNLLHPRARSVVERQAGAEHVLQVVFQAVYQNRLGEVLLACVYRMCMCM